MSLDTDVTSEMVKAGQKMADTLMTGSVAKCMGGAGGSVTWEEFVERDLPNRDLVLAYLDERIVSVTAIYLAMDRARKAAG